MRGKVTRALGAGLAALAVAAATVLLAPGAAHADGPIVAQYTSQVLHNAYADTCPLWAGEGVGNVFTNPCGDPTLDQFMSTLAQTTVAPARIPGHVYHQIAITPPFSQLFPGQLATDCLDVRDRDSGSHVTVTPCTNVTQGQFWTIMWRNNGGFSGFIYANLFSGKCLGEVVTDVRGGTNSGDLIQRTCDRPEAIWADAILTSG